jgi:hypothetical protein
MPLIRIDVAEPAMEVGWAVTRSEKHEQQAH